MGKKRDTQELFKVPSEALIRELRMEIGKRDAYISELEDGATVIKNEMRTLSQALKGSPEELRLARRDVVCMEYKAEMKRMRNTISTLRRDRESLIIRVNRT